jgi:hypothetical protein
VDQATTRVTAGEYYILTLALTNPSVDTASGPITVMSQALSGTGEPIEIVRTDAGCSADPTTKALRCPVLPSIAAGGTALATATMLVRVLPPKIEPKISTLYTISTTGGVSQCANLLSFAQTTSANRPPTVSTTLLPPTGVLQEAKLTIEGRDWDTDSLTLTLDHLPPGLAQGNCTIGVDEKGARTISCPIVGRPTQLGQFTITATLTDEVNSPVTTEIPLFIRLL